ncbi:MAG: tetratricopeptide repeat protein [Acidimicrobiales bacterium]
MSNEMSFEELSSLARDGNREAMGELGELLWTDDPVSASGWLERAVGLGSWWAADLLATLTGTSEESQRWRRVSIDLARQDADREDVDAIIFLAWLHQDGEPVQAIALYGRAAEAGSVDAMERMGSMLANRNQDEQARQWYEKAAETGSVTAMTELGILLFHERRDESIKWLRKAAEGGNVRAMITLADGLQFRDWTEALTWLRIACDLGDEEACNILGAVPLKRPFVTKKRLLALATEKKAMRIGRRAKKRRAKKAKE